MLKFPSLETLDIEAGWNELKNSIAKAAPSDRDRFYRGSYPFILAHFRQCEFDGSKADCGRFWQALILVYSWMGRGVLTNFDEPLHRYRQECARIREARQTGEIGLDDFKAIAELCNGSVIATSKFLHFLKPEAFAIWDSRVCAAIFNGKAYHHDLKNPANYLAYLQWIRALPLSPTSMSQVCEHLQIDPEVSSLRAKEYVLFMSGKPSQLNPIMNQDI